MTKLRYLMLLLPAVAAVACSRPVRQADYNTVPLPQQIAYSAGNPFRLDAKTAISYPQGDTVLQRTANFLRDYIAEFTAMQLPVEPDAAGKAIRLHSTLQNENAEAYRLTVSADSIAIDGASDAGVFYGVQTLRKSIPVESDGTLLLFPSVVITDYPRFGYRGAHLDVARHMFPVEFIKKYIDLLALHNINCFHWHLTDDQGWRIEIKKYPRLTGVGSMRDETLVGSLYDTPQKYDGKPYGGYYTQDEIREIVRYAAERFITVIPEIDMPGHMLAALKAYPELGCTGGPYEVATKWGVFDDVLCAGNPETYEFLQNVFSEILDLFPSKYIHIGGDECPKVRWEACPKCQAMIRKLGLKTDVASTAETKLQGYMVTRLQEFLHQHGREIIGWDEILAAGVDTTAIIMSWRGTEGGIEAAQKHHKAIMVPHYNLYFDYFQGRDSLVEPQPAVGLYLPLRQVYDYEPVPKELTAEEAASILGVQANLWTEYITSPEQAEYMLLPRMAALSELQWVMPDRKDYHSFLARMGNMAAIYQKEGYRFAKYFYGVSCDITPDSLVSLYTLGRGEIRYTTDGSLPTAQSALYTAPVKIAPNEVLKAVAIHPDTVSGLFTYSRDSALLR